MTRPIRITALAACTTVALGAGLARAQVAVFDPAVTFKNAAIAALKEDHQPMAAGHDPVVHLHQLALQAEEFREILVARFPAGTRLHWLGRTAPR